jgi:hypothetical protein
MKAPQPENRSSSMPWIIGIVLLIAIIFLITRMFDNHSAADRTFVEPEYDENVRIASAPIYPPEKTLWLPLMS